MVNTSQISEYVAMYLNGAIDLDSFEDWIVGQTWNIHLASDPEAEELTFAIEEALAELSSGHITTNDFREELKRILYGVQPVTASLYGSAIVREERPALERERSAMGYQRKFLQV